MYQSFLACVVQASPVYLDRKKSIEKTIDLIERSAKAGAKFIAFPELWLPGYPWWVWLDEMTWADSRALNQRYFDQALDFQSTEAKAIAQCAARLSIHVLVGAAERIGDKVYIAQWLINELGQTLLHRRKLKPGLLELKIFSEGGIQDLPVVNTSLGRIGALACAEHRHPLFKHVMHLQKEMLHVAAWPSFPLRNISNMASAETFLAISRTYALEGCSYVLAPCAVVSQDVVALLCDTAAKCEMLTFGGGYAQIFAPNGDPLCQHLPEDEEGLLYAQINPKISHQARMAFDLTGHSARSDVVRLDLPSLEIL